MDENYNYGTTSTVGRYNGDWSRIGDMKSGYQL